MACFPKNTFKAALRQKYQLLVYIAFHALPVLNTPFPKISK